jgi:hypothetical protein
VSFALNGEPFERFIQFFEHCWVSHGIFYSLVRTNILRSCEFIGQSFIAADWAIDLYLASKGKINRTEIGYTIFGIKGVSSGSDSFKAFRNDAIELLLPFYRLTRYVSEFTAGWPLAQRIRIFSILLKLNLFAAVYPLLQSLHSLRRAILGARKAGNIQ